MERIIIDPSGERMSLLDYCVVSNETEFLCNFTSADRLWIKGERISQWAERFYSSRGIPYEIKLSPKKEVEKKLKCSVDFFSIKLLEKIVNIIDNIPVLDKLKPGDLIASLTNQCQWKQKPGLEHLLTILFLEIPDELLPLVEIVVAEWIEELSGNGLKTLYSKWLEDRESLIEEWLGMFEKIPEWRLKISNRPENVPEQWEKRYIEYWKKAIIDSEGEKLTIVDVGSQYSMEIVSKIAYDYFIKRKEVFRHNYLLLLLPYLTPREKKTLEDISKYGKELESFPVALKIGDVDKVMQWCINYYGHKRFNLCNDYKTGKDYYAHSSGFTQWFLDFYTSFRNKPVTESPLNIRVRNIVSNALLEKQVLWIIVDGLGYWEHRYLVEQINNKYNKLQITQGPIPLFSVIPSITSIAKWSLITGEFISEADNPEEPLRAIFYKIWENSFYSTDQNIEELRIHLREGNNKLYCLDTTKLDSLYHDYSDMKSLHNAVESHLDGLSKTISELFQEHPISDNLSLIISGDHGQLLGYSTVRRFSSLDEKKKGRVLFAEPDCNENIFRIDQEKFGTNKDYWILLSDENFGARKEVGGKALGVHGGVFPEELLVACSVLQFNPVYKSLDIQITGSGTKKVSGEIGITVRNTNDAAIENLTVNIKDFQKNNNCFIFGNILSLQKVERSFFVSEWPDSEDENELKITAVFEYNIVGGNDRISQKVESQLTCRDMYETGVSLLDEF